MTTTPIDAAAGTPTAWVLRRTDPGGEEVLPGSVAAAGELGLGFADLLDVINPLQHLPVIGALYRDLTGDTISDAARMAGSALYGGPLGLVSAFANTVVEAETGRDIGGTTLAWLTGGDEAAGMAGTVAADAAPAGTATPAAVVADAAGTPGTGGGPAPATSSTASPAAASTAFDGRAADRLDAFIRNANAVRRPDAVPGALDPTRLGTEALTPPTVAARSAGDRDPDESGTETDFALVADGNTSVSDWMLRALDKYEHMKRKEAS